MSADNRRIVITGGPGAGKTALLELVRRHFCEHVAVLPESAGIVFGGGFPRHTSSSGMCAAQRAIYRVQVELERLQHEEAPQTVALCDRGTLDGTAYWPGDLADFWRDLETSAARELARYYAVVHLRTPPPREYNHENPLRIESARQAAAIDARITAAWQGHARVLVVDHAPLFVDKMRKALDLVRELVPPCSLCRP